MSCWRATTFPPQFPGHYHEISFAQDLANLSGGVVISATGLLSVRELKDGRISIAAEGFESDGSPTSIQFTTKAGSSYLGDRIDYDNNTGTATIFSSTRTGSIRPPTATKIKLKDGK